jgi:hypothetical protein
VGKVERINLNWGGGRQREKFCKEDDVSNLVLLAAMKQVICTS